MRDIIIALEEEGIISPVTNKPYTVGTIHGDLIAIEKEWKDHAIQDINTHKARILSEVAAIKRTAWEKEDIRAALLAIERECKILGIDSPQVIKILEEHTEFKQLIFAALECLPDEVRGIFIAHLSELPKLSDR